MTITLDTTAPAEPGSEPMDPEGIPDEPSEPTVPEPGPDDPLPEGSNQPGEQFATPR